MFAGIMHHLDQHSLRLLVRNQSAATIQEIVFSTGREHKVEIILLDFVKAFDKVSHTGLLHKL